MSFVHPSYLWFLSLIGIPIIIHLFHFRRYKKLYFPSLKFILQLDEEKKSVKKIKRWLILATRILAFACIVFAFAQPYVNDTQQTSTQGIPVVSIYLDNSYSMSAKGTEGELLSEIREYAKNIVEQSNSNTRFLIFTNALSGEERILHTKATAFQYLDKIDYNRSPRKLGEVLNWQDEFLDQYHAEEMRIGSIDKVILSDFQQSTTLVNELNPSHPSKYHLIQCVPQKQDNLYIDSVWMESPVHRAGQQCQIFYRAVNEGDEDSKDCNINVTFGNQKRMANLDILAHSNAIGSIYFTPNNNGYIEGKISISDRNVLWDDDFYFVNQISSFGNILVVNGENAVEKIGKVYDVEGFYKYKELNQFQCNQRDLRQVDLLVLNGLNKLPSGFGEMIHQFYKNGGSVFLIPGNQINPSDYKTFLSQFGLPNLQTFTSNGNQVADIDYKSIFFKGMFENERKNLNLPLIKKAYSIRNIKQSEAKVLLKMRNNLPLFLQTKDKGNFFMLTTPLQPEFGSITDNAIFPSILLRSAELSLKALPLYFTIGKSAGFSIESMATDDLPITLLDQNKSAFIPRQVQDNGITQIQLNNPIANEILKEGIYALKDENPFAKIALNLNRLESDMQTFTQEEIESMLEKKGVKNMSFSTLKNGPSAMEVTLDKPSTYWRIFVWLSVLFLLTEMAILKFWK
ncbi:MAG: hypothetical protein EBR91_06855 [Flavobacteriia bacterium]|nr:hypothetical protein [Flavobacteriia bacterium]NBY41303.1 hypothetical protein [Flavobacteriia bacterium]